MPIRTDQIDPLIRDTFKERVAQIVQSSSLDPASARIKSARNTSQWAAMRKFSGYFVGGFSLILLSPLGIILGERLGEEGILGIVLCMIGGGAALLISGSARVMRDLNRYVDADAMRAAGSFAALTRTEQLYCEALGALIDAEPNLSEENRDELLRQINDLLAGARRLESVMQQQAAMTSGGSLEHLERELRSLEERRENQQDASARRIMDQSITLCAQRLEASRAMAPLLEQSEAQRELIHQTLASFRASLVRVQSAGAVSIECEAQELQGAVTQTYDQARAVEQAVEELKATIG